MWEESVTFKKWVASLAKVYGKSEERIAELWTDYCQQSRLFDQSPVQSEFLEWYKDKLNAH